MTTMEMDTQRVMLAREILNTDNVELLREMVKAHKRIIARFTAKEAVAEPEPDSKEYIMQGLKEAFQELKEIKAGMVKGRPLEEMLKELEAEEVE